MAEWTAEYRKEYYKVYNASPERVAQRLKYKQSERGKAVNKASRQRNWSKHKTLREQQLMARYGITVEDYERILKAQDSKCAICRNQPETRLHVDHCHETNRVRGLLCGTCNRGLGMFKDMHFYLDRAADYLLGI